MAGKWGEGRTKNLLVDEKIKQKIEAAKNIDDVDDILLWASASYIIDSNAILFYRATHNIADDVSDASVAAKARQWIKTPKVIQTLDFAKKSMLASDFMSPSMRLFVENNDREVVESISSKEGVTKEDLVKFVEIMVQRAMRGEGDFKDSKNVIDQFMKMKGWTNDDDEENDTLFTKTIHYFLPYECAKCYRGKMKICNKCMYEREAYNELTKEEKEWIKKNEIENSNELSS